MVGSLKCNSRLLIIQMKASVVYKRKPSEPRSGNHRTSTVIELYKVYDALYSQDWCQESVPSN